MAIFTWAEEDTGVLVDFTGKKGKKLRPPKATRGSRPSLPGVAPRPGTIEIPDPRPVLRALALFFIVAVAATGGFAVGAFTYLGTDAEAYVLGPPAHVTTPAEQRARALEAEVGRLQGELATQERASADVARDHAAVPASPRLQLGTTWRTDVRSILADRSTPRAKPRKR